MERGLEGKAAIVAASSKGLGKACALGLAAGVSSLVLVLWAFGFAAQSPTGQWVTKAPMPTPRTEVAVAPLGGKVYVVGGFGGSGDVVEVYDPAADRWERRQPMPTARSGIAGVAHAGRLLVFGGEEPAGTFNQAEAYAPAADRWTALAPMPTARHGLGAAVVGGVVYVIGGGPRPGGSFSAVNEAFVP